MNIVRRIVVGLAGVIAVALVLAIAEPKAVHAVVSALVTVSNGTGNPVPTVAVDTRNVNVVNTPNVNVTNTVPVTGNVNATLTGTPTVSFNGNVPVANPSDQNQNPIPLDVESNDYSPVQAACSGFSSGNGFSNFSACSPAITVPAGTALIIDDVSITAFEDPGVTPQGNIATIGVANKNGGGVDFYIPLQAQGTAPGSQELLFVGAQRMHLYTFPTSRSAGPVFCEVDTAVAQSSSAGMRCVIVGHLVTAH